MRLVSFNGVAFSASVNAKWDSLNSPSSSRNAVEMSRIGADPILSGIEVGTQIVTASFVSTGVQVENSLATVLGIINPDRPVPGILAAEMVDGTDVETIAVPGSWRYVGVNQLLVDFIVATPGWRASSATTLLAATTYTADGNFPNLNTGLRDSLPTVTAYWPTAGSNRSSPTSTYGYKSKLAYTLTNNGAEPIINEPWQIGPIRAAAGAPFGGTALSSGNDIRVFCEGVEWPRNLITGSAMTDGYMFIWVVIPFLAPGAALSLDIVMNNASAGTPPTLSYTSSPALPAIDISGQWFPVASSSATFVTVAPSPWTNDQWVGGTLITGATGTGANQMRRVLTSSATVLAVSRNFNTTPGVGTDITVIKSGLMGDGGTASGVASVVLTDSSQSWSTNEWIGATVVITGGTGSGSTGTVVSNTATALTVGSWSGTAPTAASTYNVFRKNGAWLYDVRRTSPQTHQGLWSTNRISGQPSQVNFDSPAAWYRFVLQRSRDNYSQPRSDNTTGSLWHPVMRLRRSRRGKQGEQSEVGVADSIGVSCPFGIIGTSFAYTIRNAKKQGSNPSAGMVEFKGICQEAGGEVWASFLSDTTTHDTTTAVAQTWYDLTGYGYPIRMGLSMVPNASDEIPDTDNNTAEARSTGNYFKVAINPSNTLAESPAIYPTAGTVVACYDVNLRIRTGGASSVRPYGRLEIGSTGHRLFLANNTERLVINCENHDIYLTDASGTFVRRVPWAVQPQEIIDDIDAAATTVIASRWLPIPPTVVDAAAIYFSDPSGAGWGSFRIGVTGKLGYIT